MKKIFFVIILVNFHLAMFSQQKVIQLYKEWRRVLKTGHIVKDLIVHRCRLSIMYRNLH
jgi:hypothetical protein